MFESTVSQKEAEKLRQLQSAFKARNLGEAEFAKMKKELEKSYETRMSQMEKTVNIYNIFINSRPHY